MELARHHDADLSFGRHAHTRLEDLSKVVDRLADLWLSHTLPASAVSEGPNGTTPNHRESSPERSQVDPSEHTDRFQRLEAEAAAVLGGPLMGSLAAISWLISSSLPAMRSAGSLDPNATAPAMQATPPAATAAGAPSRPASRPASKAPKGAIPMNIME